MSNDFIKSLDSIVSLITDRVNLRKDLTKSYIGLEHLPSGGTVLQGTAEAGQSVSTNSVFRKGDILFGKLRPRLQKSVRVQFDGYCSTDILVLRSSTEVCPAFAGFILQSDLVFAEAIRTEEGTKMPRCSWNTLRELEVFCPNVSNQKYIAEILSSIDKIITHTEDLIQKYQQIKAGLMHDLFTRGIGVDGKLRPPRDQAPELYKESAIGWIPREWEVKRLADACDWWSGGTPSRRSSAWWNGNVPWLSPKDMKFFDLSETQEHVTRSAALTGSRIMPENTVFIVIRGMILAHSFPVVYSGKEFCFNQDIKAIRGLENLNNRFLGYWFVANKSVFLAKTTESTHGTKRFDMKDIYNLHIGIPSDEEQSLFLERLDSLSGKLEFEQASLNKLKIQKSGLMHDLLTGKVPVNIDRAEVAHE